MHSQRRILRRYCYNSRFLRSKYLPIREGILMDAKEQHAFLTKEQVRETEKIQAYADEKFGEGKYKVFPANLFKKEVDHFAENVLEYVIDRASHDSEMKHQRVLGEKGCLYRLEILNDLSNHKIWDSAEKQARKIKRENAHS